MTIIVKDPCSGFGPNGDVYHLIKRMQFVETFNSVEMQLAKEFHRIVRRDLSDHLDSIDDANSDYGRSACATHDYCDANMLMAEAFEGVRGYEFTMSDDDAALWGKAWDVAKAVGFSKEWPTG